MKIKDKKVIIIAVISAIIAVIVGMVILSQVKLNAAVTYSDSIGSAETSANYQNMGLLVKPSTIDKITTEADAEAAEKKALKEEIKVLNDSIDSLEKTIKGKKINSEETKTLNTASEDHEKVNGSLADSKQTIKDLTSAVDELIIIESTLIDLNKQVDNRISKEKDDADAKAKKEAEEQAKREEAEKEAEATQPVAETPSSESSSGSNDDYVSNDTSGSNNSESTGGSDNSSGSGGGADNSGSGGSTPSEPDMSQYYTCEEIEAATSSTATWDANDRTQCEAIEPLGIYSWVYGEDMFGNVDKSVVSIVAMGGANWTVWG